MSRILQFALCSLCEGRFNVRDLRNYHGQRFPLVLQCGHAACEQCIRGTFIDRKAKTIICKVCQQVSNFSGNSKTLRTSFPLHVFLVGQFFLRSSEKQYQEPTNLSPMPAKSHRARKPNQVLCSECEVSSATCFCKQCKAPFCGSCFSAVHQMGKSLRSHVCEDISVIEMTVMCSKHPKIDLDMFCETCDVTICAKCSVLEHKDHMVVSSATKNASILPDLESSLEFAGQVRQRLKLSLKEAEALSVDDSVFLGAERELAYSLIQLHGQMQLLGAQWWRRIEEKHVENTACTHNIQSDLKTYLQDLECAMRTAHLAVQPENVTSANLVSIKDRLDNSLTAPAYVVKDEVSANVLVKLDLAGNQENVIELDLPESTEYRLVSENELPASYDLQQLPPDDFLSILSSNVDLKDQSIVPDTSDSLSNKSLSLTKTSCSSLSSSTSSIPTVVPAGMNLRKQPKPLKLSDPYDGLEKGCMVKVEVSHIISPSDFYVHLYSSLEQLNALTKKLTKESKTCEATKSIQINDCYLVEYEHEWFRGRVVRQAQSRNSNSELYEIEFLDYGNCAPVEVSSIKCLPSKYSSIPCQAIRCALYHVNFSDEVKKSANLAMINLINGHSVLLMHVLEVLDDKLLIDLSHISPEVTLNNARHPKSSIRDSMIYLGYGSFLPDSSEESKTSYKIMRKPECDSSEFVQNLDIPANSMLSVWIMHVDSPSSIYVTPHEFLDSSREIRMEIDKFVKDDKITKVKVMQPHVGKPVLAKYSEDGLFYRAQILDTTKPGIVQVIFVDYGNVECVQWDNVWHIPQSLLQYPICALHCSLTGISPPQGKAWEKPACQFLKAINHGDFKMKVISRESSNFHVCLYLCQDGSTLDVAELLEKQGFAKFTAPRTFPKQLEGVCDLQQANEEFEGQYSENHHEQDVSQTASQSPFKEVEHICVQEAFESVRDESQSIQELYTPIGSSTNSENNASVSLGVLESDPSFGILDPEPGFLQLIKKQESSVTKDAFSDGTILSIGKSENSLHVESSVGSLNDSLSSGLPTCCSDSSVLNQLSAEDLKTKSTNSHDSRTPIVTALKGSVAKSSVQSRLMQAQKHMPKNTVLPSVKLPVDVLYCESPNSIYVRVKNHNKKMERLEAELQSYYSTNDDFVSDPDWSPSVHDLCAVKSCEDDFWHRALILQVLPGLNYQVMLKDIGRVESVDKDAIRKLPEVFASVSDGVIRCHLANIKAAGAGKDVWPSISIETLKSLITEHQFKLYIAKKGSVSEVDRSLPVDLWVCESVSSALEATKEEWFTINRVLVDQGVALPIDWSSMSASDTTITASDWQVLSPSDEPNFNILVILSLKSEVFQ